MSFDVQYSCVVLKSEPEIISTEALQKGVEAGAVNKKYLFGGQKSLGIRLENLTKWFIG